MTSILKADNIQDADGNNIINESGNTITIGASGDTTNVIGTLNKDGVAVANTPSFYATNGSTDQSINDGTQTKVDFGTEILDSDSAFASSRFTVPTGKGGKYLIGFQMAFRNSAAFFKIEFSVFKNSSEDQPTLKQNFASSIFESNFTNRIHTSVIRDLSAGDVLDLRALLNAGSGTAQIMSSSTLFYGYRIGA